MRKYLSYLITFIFLLGLMGCATTGPAPQYGVTPTEETNETEITDKTATEETPVETTTDEPPKETDHSWLDRLNETDSEKPTSDDTDYTYEEPKTTEYDYTPLTDYTQEVDYNAYHIQLGAFTEYGNAQDCKTKAEMHTNESVFLVQIGDYWKVWVGNLANRPAANSIRDKLSTPFPGAWVIAP